MTFLRKKRVLLVLFITFVVLLFFTTNWMTLFYPIHYKEHIKEQSEIYEVDPFLVASIIRVESNYKTGRESRKGALGIMQLMPETAKWAMEMAKLSEVTMENIKHEPKANIQIGTWYINSLSKQFKGNRFAVIAAYNAGPGNVENWLKKGTWDGREETIKNIPFGETRHYVQRVIHYYDQYMSIYGGQF
ncbi:lytic transglycosylase domain-containing protein [Paenibacillus pini]|uniref:Soluble lytic murein transglycosylase n=1 Tax=Paenibacillus pini JCM 16418 TaxID=1236976 RepID=W7YFP7_9BACL|nr:lytic transglycosylase domain-containing protein [Paenibacillus pini]GAF06343.1 soluble lytic murein transglycosylase precursor [Paenibacillus pini JCM 16418]